MGDELRPMDVERALDEIAVTVGEFCQRQQARIADLEVQAAQKTDVLDAHDVPLGFHRQNTT